MLEPGTRLGDFELVERLGAGGMGEVWEAIDAKLERRVALKLVRLEVATGTTSSDALPRLREEAQAMAKLQHPNIAVVHDIDTVDERVFIAMELLPDGNLRQWVEASPRSWREIVAKYVAAGRGLDAAHRAGLVHCDFKPDNVLLGANGEVKVSDFGIARSLATGKDDERSFAGTPGYMAPEQITGRALDARVDQFSYCIALWEALSGIRPFETATVTGVPTVAMHLAAMTRPQPMKRLAAIPRAIERVLRRGLSPAPSQRFSTMTDLLDALERAARTPERRMRRVVMVGASVLVLAAVTGALVLGRARSGDDPCVELANAPSHEVWHASKGELLRGAFAATRLPYAGDVAERAIASLDDWREKWRVQRADVCRAQRARTGDLDRLAGRAECLDSQLVRMRHHVQRLTSDVTPRYVDRALELAQSDPEDCRHVGGLPDDPALRARVAGIEDRIRAIDIARFEGRRIADDHVATLIADAERVGWPPIANRVRVAAALLARQDEACKRAIELTAPVAESAAAAGQLDLESRVWEIRLDCFARIGETAGLDHAIVAARALAAKQRGTLQEVRLAALVAMSLSTLGRLGEAEKACGDALALAEARSRDDGQVANAHQCLVGIYVQRGDAKAAVEHAEAAVAARQRVFGDAHVLVANELDALAVAYHHATRSAESLSARRRALAIRERVFGPDAPQLADSTRGIALMLAALGREVEARPYADRAIALAERDPELPAGERVIFHLTAAHAWIAEPDRARTAFDRALQLCDTHAEKNPRACAVVHIEYADLRAEQRDCKGAIPHYERGATLLALIEGIDPSAGLTIAAARGRCLVEAGRVNEGLAELERADGAIDATAAPGEAGEIKYAFARALHARARARSVELANAATALFDTAGDPKRAAAVRAWLASR